MVFITISLIKHRKAKFEDQPGAGVGCKQSSDRPYFYLPAEPEMFLSLISLL